jgi:hypothetical protein
MTVSARDNPNGKYGILAHMERHLEQLIDAKRGEWSDMAIETLENDLERFREFRADYGGEEIGAP